MKAAAYREKVGLVIEDVPTPEPADDQVLVKVINTGFCGSDHSLIETGGLADGTILGHETSGIVVDKGAQVDSSYLDNQVIIRPTFCGECPDCKKGKPYLCLNDRRSIGIGDLPGAFAEYFVAYPQMLIPIPDKVDFPNAALAEAFSASLHGINQSKQQGGSALVMGGGPIGLAAIKLLKIMGFGPVILSEPLEERRKLALTLGADAVVDPFNENLGASSFQLTQGLGIDSVFECSGAPNAVKDAMDLVTKGGTICIISVMFKDIAINPLTMNFKEIWMTAAYSNTHEENKQILNWMAEGKLDGTPLISETIKLEDLPQTYQERIHPGKSIKVMLEIGQPA